MCRLLDCSELAKRFFGDCGLAPAFRLRICVAAAAVLADMAGATLRQSVWAASLALQSMLGLICNLIANRVEAPCLGKNVLAATNALA